MPIRAVAASPAPTFAVPPAQVEFDRLPVSDGTPPRAMHAGLAGLNTDGFAAARLSICHRSEHAPLPEEPERFNAAWAVFVTNLGIRP